MTATTSPDTGVLVLAEAHWPVAGRDPVPGPLPGFVLSSFAPLVAQAADDCLRQVYGAPPADPGRGERTAVVVVSATGDGQTAAAVAASVDEGRRMSPLLFFQSVPNSVAGRVALTWRLLGPVVCTSPVGDPMADAVAVADLLLADGADEVLLVLAEQDDQAGRPDRAHALLLARTDPLAQSGEGVPQ